VCWGCERSFGGGVWDREAGSGWLGSGRLFGWTVGARFGSARFGSGWLFGWAVGGRLGSARFGSGRLFGAGCSGRAARFSGCAAGVLTGG
jgi:hypothetical protein